MARAGKLGISGIVLGLVLSTVAPASADRPAEQPAATGQRQTITLVTGDRVTIVDGRPGAATPGPGREGMTFSASEFEGHAYVIPADATRLVNTGRVDRRLFDITTLLEFGYDDRMPLIVTGDALPTVRSARNLPAVNGMAVEADSAGTLWKELTDGARTAAGVSKVWLDGQLTSTLDRSTAQIGAPAAWGAGYTGEGVTVAVLDTGVDQTHPDLADREIAEQNFTDAPDNRDDHGHGTHVASTVAGTGTGTQSGGKYRGVASGVSILDGKVLDHGFGQESWILAGMHWAAEQGADIVNMSLGGENTPETDPIEEAVNTLTAEYDTLFVVAVGNTPGTGTVSTPATAAAALAVGAVDRADQLADFSSQGPAADDGGLKPDVTAPGVDIVAARADGAADPPVESGYSAMSGTSMAAPHVAGAAALLAQQHPDWTAARLKAALMASAAPNPALSAFDQGAGRVDLARAIEQTVLSEPASVSLGLQQWPHDDDQPVTRPLTYRNLSTEDVTLSLALETTAPAGLFALSADEVTVPAGGTAEVAITGDTRIDVADGNYSGAVVATAGTTRVRTPVGIVREVESYRVTINYLDATGAPAAEGTTQITGQSLDFRRDVSAAAGTVELRLPRGRYVLDHLVTTGEQHAVLAQPSLELTGDTTITVDARTAAPVRVTPPAEADLTHADIGFEVVSARPFESVRLFDDLRTVSTGQIGAPPPAGEVFTGKVHTRWVDADGSFYGLAWFPVNEMPTGLTEVVTWDEVATVHADVGTSAPGRTAYRTVYPIPTHSRTFSLSFTAEEEFSLPGGRTEYLTTEGQRWRSYTSQDHDGTTETSFTSPDRAYQPGREHHPRYNYGMFGPTLPHRGWSGVHGDRYGDLLTVDVPLFGDSSGNGGSSLTTSARTALYQGDHLIGENTEPYGRFLVPPEEHEYRVTMAATRAEPFSLSTSVSAEWTFRSGHGDTEPLGLSALRFHPKLDDANAAPAGRPFAVPVLLERNSGGTERARGLTVEVSYDEGTTWERAPVLLGTVAVLDHPADADSVSLRASARDSDGNTVRQTIIRAYHLR